MKHTASPRRATSARRRRDRAIVQLWRNGWTAKRIATHLDITQAIVGNVVHQNGAARNTRPAPGNTDVVAAVEAQEAYRAYFWRVMHDLYRQVDASGGACPRFVTIPKPADDYQRDQITETIEWWARQAFGLSTIEIRTDQRQAAH